MGHPWPYSLARHPAGTYRRRIIQTGVLQAHKTITHGRVSKWAPHNCSVHTKIWDETGFV
jgi:hypothetical protein